MPILKGGERKKTARRTEQAKNVIVIGVMAFFLMYNRMGLVNRVMFAIVSTQSLIFFTKCYFYKSVVDELNVEMTLTGQESRIMTRYYFPEHASIDLYIQLCNKYLKHSENVKKQEDARMAILSETMQKQKKLDEEFLEKLKSFDMPEDD